MECDMRKMTFQSGRDRAVYLQGASFDGGGN